MEALSISFQIMKNWWWIFFPFPLFFLARFFYFWWARWELYYRKTFQWILLEIIPAKENKKPFSAMEAVLSSLWGIIDIPNWRERWTGGELPLGGGGWFSLEICYIEGKVHFYIRIPSFFKDAATSSFYSQFPDIEIVEVEDYTKKIPRDIPNEKWDLRSEDYVLAKEEYYPIKTYTMFFERPEEEKRVAEEKRIDPLDTLLEAFSTLKPTEQIWIQIVCNPIVESIFPWMEKGKEEINKITKRTSRKKPTSLFQELLNILFPTPAPQKEKTSPLELVAPELRLTPVEKEIVTAIENKMKKPAFECWIKGVWIYRKDKPYTPGANKLIRSYFMGQFSTVHLNYFTYFGVTRMRIHYWFREMRLYLRKRQRLREAIERLPAFFPWNLEGEPPLFLKFLTLFGYRIPPGRRSVCVLNIEELATIFHLPLKVYLPIIHRVEAKKVPAPPLREEKHEIPPPPIIPGV